MIDRKLIAAGAAALVGFLALTAKADGVKTYDKQSDPWYQSGQAALGERLSLQPNTAKAKNVIVFIADGFGVTAETAARIYDGQMKGLSGEENTLAWERFPYNALVKTYSASDQIPSSAATASAIATGIKVNANTISAPDSVVEGDCAALIAAGYPETLAEKASSLGKATGVISTAPITDATPSTQYAHSARRAWWNPEDMPEAAVALGCKDIALQLFESDVDVALGGGRNAFIPGDASDVEEGERTGRRSDGRDLTGEWLTRRANSAYVTSSEELAALDTGQLDSLLGLFSYSSMLFEDESANDGRSNPTLAEMTGAAIDILSRDEDGFFLLVEHEGTDDLQHLGSARNTLDAAREFSDAVALALSKVDLSDTLIVVTADHGQAMVFSGEAPRGNPILGLAHERDGTVALAEDGKPYTTVGFYEGPGAFEGERPDLSGVDTSAPDFHPQALLPGYVQHSGEDVPVYANGPWAHLFGGLMEQNVLFHIIAYAMNPDAGDE